MKWSLYNELIEDVSNKDIIYLFNTLHSKYFAIDADLKNLLNSGMDDVSTIAQMHPDLYEYLVTERFIVSKEYDEISECVRKINHRFASDDNLRITINPTLDCNLRCWYCYENHLSGSCMERSTIESLMKFIDMQARSKMLRTIHLSFFGGEPLMKYTQVVKPILERCNVICNKYNKRFVVSFTTNGVCLTPTIVDELNTLSSEVSVQVAFDGNQSMHDKVKCFPNGSGSYEIVKKQLAYAIANDIITTIRCNYTLENLMSFRELIDDFKEFWSYKNVRFSFHKVWQESESKELCELRDIFKQEIVALGIKSNIESYYGDRLTPCYADFDSHIVVNFNGDIYKCTARDFKPEHKLGYLDKSGIIVYNDVAKRRYESRLTKQCLNCRLLPICTICFQQRSESTDGMCPEPETCENASVNIVKYFHDVTKYSGKYNHSEIK